jgi:two-component system, chemotaxis family, chemotaxis protein CheY
VKLFKRGAKRRVLIVDDDQDIRETLSEALEHEGFQVLTARDGNEALIHLDAPGELPDVILLDLMMPRMNGFELREVLRRHPVFAGIPVVAITASSDGGRFDAPAVMRKPIPLQNLLDAIDRVDAARASTATG